VADEAQPGYAAALVELEAIIEELDDDGIDIDLLGTKVARAAELIKLCRDRIAGARVQVDRVVASLEGVEPDES